MMDSGTDEDKRTVTLPAATTTARSQVAANDDATVMADTPGALTEDSIVTLQEKGKLVQVDRDAISEHARENDPIFKQKDANGDYLPIFVMPHVGDLKQTAIVVDPGDGQKIIVANEGIHNWDADYVNAHILKSNPDIAADREYTAASKFQSGREETGRYHELLKHISDSAGSDTQVLISTEPGVTDAYGFKSKEGTNYLVIPQSELEYALSDKDRTRKLAQSIDAFVPDTRELDNKAEQVIATHAGEQYIAALTDKDNKISFKDAANPSLSQASLDGLVKSKALILVPHNELDPDVRNILETGGLLPDNLKIYLVPGANNDFKGESSGAEGKTTDANPTNYILIDESMHVQSMQYVKEHVMQKDADMARQLADGSLTKLDHSLAKTMHVPKDVQLLVTTDETATSVTSLQTTEGKNYIIIPKEDADGAHGSKENMSTLQREVNKQLESIRSGADTAESLAHGNDADRWMAQNFKLEGANKVLPDQNTEMDNATLDNLAKTGRLMQLQPGELTPEARAAIADAKDAGGHPLPPGTPVYLMPNVNSDGAEKDAGEVMRTKEGKYFIVVNEKAHAWTMDDVPPTRDGVLGSLMSTPSHLNVISRPEDALKDILNEAKPEERAAITQRYRDLMLVTDQLGDTMETGKQVVITDNKGNIATNGAASLESKEGTRYIILSKNELKDAITSDQGLQDELLTIGHETSHNAHKHSIPQNALARHDPNVQREYEMRAYLGGNGPLGVADPLAGAKVYEDQLLNTYNDKNPNDRKQKLTDQEMKAVSQSLVDNNYDAPHPSAWDLIQALRHEDGLMKAFDAKYKAELGHDITDEPLEAQKRIRTQEAKQVEDQTVEFMKDKLQVWDNTPHVRDAQPPKATDPKDVPKENPQAALPDHAMADIEHARALFQMHSSQKAQNVDNPSASFVPNPIAVENQGQTRSVAS